MTTKPLLLAGSMLALVACSGQVFAGTSNASRRPASSDVQSASAAPARQSQNAFGSIEAPQPTGLRYHGGPKSNVN